MKRFLMVLAIAATAGAIYVTEAPGRPSRTRGTSSSCACGKQIKALQKDVAALKMQLKQVKQTATSALGFIEDCFVGVVPVSRFGDAAGSSYGYWYTPSGGQQGYRTALDTDPSPTPGAELQAVRPECAIIYEARHRPAQSGSGHLFIRPERVP